MNETDINVLCRLCLNKSYFYSNIYVGQSSHSNPFYEDINYVYDLHISGEDGPPEYVCQKCLGMVKEFKMYKTNAHVASLQLMHLKQKMNCNVTEEDIEKDGKFLSMGEEFDNQESTWETEVIIKQEPVDFDECSFDKEIPHEESDVTAEAQIDNPSSLRNLSNDDGSELSRFPVKRMTTQSSVPQNSNRKGRRDLNDSRCEDYGKRYNHNFRGHNIFDTSDIVYDHEQCKMEFSEKETMVSYKRVRKPILSYSCDYCRQKFTSKSELGRHIKRHTGERQYECSDCGKKFFSKSVLTKHKRIHKGDRPHVCEDCKKTFITKWDLEIHVRIHTGERPYGCSECGKNFISKSVLSRHKRTHTGDKPYECNECKKRFSTKWDLEIHMRIHTGERPYKCEDCGKRYISLSVLSRHKRIHT